MAIRKMRRKMRRKIRIKIKSIAFYMKKLFGGYPVSAEDVAKITRTTVDLKSLETANSYGNALKACCKDRKALNAISNDLAAIFSFIEESSIVEEYLANPTMNSNGKRETLKILIGRNIKNPEVSKWLNVLAERNRLECINPIIISFFRKITDGSHVELFEITIARPLGGKNEKFLKRVLTQSVTTAVVLVAVKIDPDLMAGVVVENKSTVFTLTAGNEVAKFSQFFGLDLNSTDLKNLEDLVEDLVKDLEMEEKI